MHSYNFRIIFLAAMQFFAHEDTRHSVKENCNYNPLFDTPFLCNPNLVKKHLIANCGFENITIKAEKHALSGLLLKRPGAQYTVISLAGFLPGKMTGMATLYELLPSNCNILFINLRGKGDSTGRLDLCKIWNYGVYEYQDVIAALKYCEKEFEGTKIVIHGVCAGSFHGMKALYKLAATNDNDSLKKQITAIIVDSGFASIEEMSKTAIPNFFMKISGKGTYSSKILGTALCSIYQPLRTMFYSLAHHSFNGLLKDEITLSPLMMRKITQEMPKLKFLFLHGVADQSAPLSKLSDLTAAIDESSKTITQFEEDHCHHALLHLKFRQQYKKALTDFLNNQDLSPD